MRAASGDHRGGAMDIGGLQTLGLRRERRAMICRLPRTLAQHWAMPLRIVTTLAMVACLAACASLPPGADHPKGHSTALTQPQTTPLGKQLAAQAKRHPGLSGFRLLQHGPDGLMLRTQLVAAAERTIDI